MYMGIFKNFKHNSAVDRLNEERIYEIVINEIKSGKRREGIWGQALEKANGDLKKTEANYIKLRVQSLKDEFEIQKQENADRQIIGEEFHQPHTTNMCRRCQHCNLGRRRQSSRTWSCVA